VIKQAAGVPCDEYLNGKLFQPLGITAWKWSRDTAGHPLTYAELQMTARVLAKVGWLIANGGKWGQKQVFPPKWIGEFAKPGGPNERCGLIWWLGTDAAQGGQVVYHTGYLGQYLVIMPKRKLVGVRVREYDAAPKDRAREFGAFMRMLADL